MKFTISIVLTFLLFASCTYLNNGNEKEHEIPDYAISYPKIVDSLNIHDLYDSSLWFIYTWNCDINYSSNGDSINSKPLGIFSLTYSGLKVKHDTVEFRFNFQDKNGIIQKGTAKNNRGDI